MTKIITIYLTNKPTYSIFAASHMYTLSKGNLQSEYPGLFVNEKLSMTSQIIIFNIHQPLMNCQGAFVSSVL
jgi:hypothetical protein